MLKDENMMMMVFTSLWPRHLKRSIAVWDAVTTSWARQPMTGSRRPLPVMKNTMGSTAPEEPPSGSSR